MFLDINSKGDDCEIIFKKCSIRNAVDGTEGDFIYDRDDENSSDDSSSDFYDEKAKGRDFMKIFGDSDIDSRFEGLL